MKILEMPHESKRFTVKNYSGAAVGDVVDNQSVKVAAVTTEPRSIIVEAPSTKFPQHTLLGLGDGALLDMETLISAAAPNTVIYSNGTGGYTTTKPVTGTAGQTCYQVGVIEGEPGGASTTTLMRVRIDPIRVEA